MSTLAALKESGPENGAQLEENKTRGISYGLAESTLSYRKALKTARSDYFSSLLEENKHDPRYLFNTVAKLTKNKTTSVDICQQHSSNDFMNYFTSKINTIRDQTVTMQLPATISHQTVLYRSPEEQFHSFSTIGEEDLHTLV